IMHPARVFVIGALGAWALALASPLAATSEQSLRDKFFVSGGIRIHYVESGHGAPVVLIHGLAGSVERHWLNSGILAGLAADHRVIALDLRGHGKSGKPHDPKAYGREMSRDVIRLLDHLRIQRADIVGFSLGAIIAADLLTTHEDRCRSVALVAHPPLPAWDSTMAASVARTLEGPDPFTFLVRSVAPAGEPPSEEEVRTTARSLLASNDPHALAALQPGLRELVVSKASMQQARVPVLGVIGSLDNNVAALRYVATIVPGMKLVVVDGATHTGARGILRRPELMSALRSFLERSPSE